MPPVETAFAEAPSHVLDLIRGPARRADVLGVFPTAMYLRLQDGGVVALLTSDAVRLPIGVVLATPSQEFPLDRLTGPVVVGLSTMRVGDWRAYVSRVLQVEAPTGLIPDARIAEHLWDRLTENRSGGTDLRLPEALSRSCRSPLAAAELVHHLLGSGPGLTPAGDDILAGMLVGAWSFGVAADLLRIAVLDGAPEGTTDLSRALLLCAVRGESIPPVDGLLLAISGMGDPGEALARLGFVGNTSGAALASGVLAAAMSRLRSSVP